MGRPDTGLRCKCRPDRVPAGNKGVILDLKTTRNADKFAFRRDVAALGYAREGGMYLSGFAQATGANYQDLIFSLIAVEKEEPYRVEVYTLSVDFIDYGFWEYKRLLQIEAKCRENNFWPNYKEAGAVEIEKPSYLMTHEMEG
jgi:hypothetical protein